MMQKTIYSSAALSSLDHSILQFRIQSKRYLIIWITFSTQTEIDDSKTGAFRRLRICNYSTGKTDILVSSAIIMFRVKQSSVLSR